MLVNKKYLAPLLLGLIVQICTSWNSLFFHSDEYFQIIEFAAHRYHIAPTNEMPWEFVAEIRPTLQIHFFALFYKVLSLAGIHNRFLVVSLLSTLTGLCLFAVSNFLIIDKFRNKSFLVPLLWINNFFWIIPFLRCRYSSEIVSALLWIVGVLLFERLLAKKTTAANALFLLFTGAVFAFSFYCRFQIIFALAGLVPWFLFQSKNKWHKALLVCLGFAAGIAANIFLDRYFYGHFVFTPYRYFFMNIVEGKASSFGTSPWWLYIVILMCAGIPLAGLALFAFFAKGLSLYKNPFALGSLFFIIAHSIVPHKEERFIFPVILVMVYLAAEAFAHFPEYEQKAKALWKHQYLGWAIRFGCYFSVVINVFLVILLSLVSYKQPVLFIKNFNEQLVKPQQIISFKQHPYETESGLRYAFFSENKYNNYISVINDKELFVKTLQQNPSYKYCILLADAKNNNLDYLLENKHAIVSSYFIWNAANWMAKRFGIIIPDLWICQTYNEVSSNGRRQNLSSLSGQ